MNSIAYMAAPGIQVKSVSTRLLISAVCDEYDVSVDEFHGKDRYMEISDARAVFCYIMRRRTEKTLVAIGDLLNRNHATIMHLARKGAALVETCTETRAKYYLIISKAFPMHAREN